MDPAQYKSIPGNNMVSRRNHLLFHFLITIYYSTSISLVFIRQNATEKKKLGEMLIEQIIKLELRGPGPPLN